MDWLEKWKEYFLTWYDEGNVEEKAEEAAEFSEQFLDDGIVSVSGGKDSMAMLHIIVNRCREDVNVFHWDHGKTLMPREIEREIISNIWSVSGKIRLRVDRYVFGDCEKARSEWKKWYNAFFGTLSKLGYKYHLLGIRAEESCRRQAKGRIVSKSSWIEVYPIYHFSWKDVWGYVFKHRVPVPRVYFMYAKLLGWDKVRLVTFFDKEFEKYGSPQLDGVLAWRWKHDKSELP